MKLPKLLLHARLNAAAAVAKWDEQVAASDFNPYFSRLEGRNGSYTNCTCQCKGLTGTVANERLCGVFDTTAAASTPSSRLVPYRPTVP